jgi:D-alanyl-D-alanine carboxypeptidase/D-alanyl-D-alanine-endopeptidase (penicillin-binding protein 4)
LSRGRLGGGLIAAIVAFCMCAAVAASAVVFRNPLTDRLGAPRTSWHAGTPLSALTVLPPAPAAEAPEPAAAQVAAAVQPLLAAPALGANVAAVVLDVQTGQVLAGQHPDVPTVPASTIKLVTAAAALTALGPTHRLRTTAVAGPNPGEVVLVGGGDPTLSGGRTGTYPDAARLPDLADQVKRALGGSSATKVVYDPSLFSGPPYGAWDPDIPGGGNVSAITALMTDGGRVDPKNRNGVRVPEPDLSAARTFASLLGVPTTDVVRGGAPQGARELGAVLSPPVLRLVEMMEVDSDNVIAESLARHVAIQRHQPATFEGGAAAETAVLGELGFPAAQVALFDGSGLSRNDKVSPSLLAKLLTMAAGADHPQLRALLTGLPVSAYSGTLRERFRKPTAGASAAGVVRAKTGTLRSVSAVAGVVTTVDGRALAFAVLADAVPIGGTVAAQDALDRVVAALAACGCR